MVIKVRGKTMYTIISIILISPVVEIIIAPKSQVIKNIKSLSARNITIPTVAAKLIKIKNNAYCGIVFDIVSKK